jgi:hypothetical protein
VRSSALGAAARTTILGGRGVRAYAGPGARERGAGSGVLFVFVIEKISNKSLDYLALGIINI